MLVFDLGPCCSFSLIFHLEQFVVSINSQTAAAAASLQPPNSFTARLFCCQTIIPIKERLGELSFCVDLANILHHLAISGLIFFDSWIGKKVEPTTKIKLSSSIPQDLTGFLGFCKISFISVPFYQNKLSCEIRTFGACS